MTSPATIIGIDDTQFRARLNELASLGIPAGKIVRVEARKLIETLINFTPPSNKSRGVRAVTRDVVKVARPVDADRWNSAAVRKMVRERNYKAFGQFMKRGQKEFARKTLVRWSPELHQKARNNRGRVSFSTNRLTLDHKEWTGYLKRVQGMVGAMKAAWVVGGRRVQLRIPSWVLAVASRVKLRGFVDDRLTDKNPTITFGNHARGVGVEVGQQRVRNALNTRAKAIGANIKRMIQHGPGKMGTFAAAYQ